MKFLPQATQLALLVVGLIAVAFPAFAQGPVPEPNDRHPPSACSHRSDAIPTLSAAQATAAALAANPGTTALAVGLEDENGCLVYSVQLSNGANVKVDAGNGQLVHTEAGGADDRHPGQQDDGNKGQQDDGNKGQQDDGRQGQQDDGNKGQQDDGNKGQQDDGRQGQQDDGNKGQQDDGHQGQQDDGNKGQQDDGNHGNHAD